jgi:hypothetical protein
MTFFVREAWLVGTALAGSMRVHKSVHKSRRCARFKTAHSIEGSVTIMLSKPFRCYKSHLYAYRLDMREEW